MANVLGELFQDIADAIREKTGSTDTMAPADFPAEIGAIETGGGSVEGVHFVTFMSEDGTVELYKRPVADGDDCADVVERGLIDEPNKESDGDFMFPFSGWAATPEGVADEAVLKAVTEDKSVYAAFESELGGSCGANVTWKLKSNGDFIISGEGDMANYTAINLPPWHNYSTSIKTVTVEDGVTSIAKEAFKNYSNLTQVSLSNSVVSIGSSAFEGTSLTNLNIPNGVEKVDNAAFCLCKSLTTVVIGEGVTYMGIRAFDQTALTSATFKDTETWWITSGATLDTSNATQISISDLGDKSTAANYLKSKYSWNYWHKI